MATLEDLVTDQVQTAKFIEKIYGNMMKAGKRKVTAVVLETRLNSLEEYWKSYCIRHFQIMRNPAATSSQYVKGDHFTITEEFYFENREKLQEDLEGLQKISAPSKTSTVSAGNVASGEPTLLKQIQLPKIQLPTFDGDQLAWELYRDLFKALVHEVAGISGSVKLQHLKASLSGEAAAVISNIPMTDQGYAGAWEELTKRYDNPRLILRTHMRNFLSCSPTTK